VLLLNRIIRHRPLPITSSRFVKGR
jgi:hypothetical protein